MKIKNIVESTTSGAVAAVATPIGKPQKRAGSLFKGKTTNKPFYEGTDETYKPKIGDKVHAGHGQKGGAGVTGTVKKIENDWVFIKNDEGRTFKSHISKVSRALDEAEINEQDLIIVPGQGHRLKPGFIPKDKDRTDHEVEMAKSDLYHAAKNAKMLYDMIKDISEEEGLEGWVQEKIIKANDYLNTVREYMEHKSMKKEGSAGAKIGAVAGAALTKSLPGAIKGAQIGSSIQDMFERDDALPGGVLAGGMSNFEEGVTEEQAPMFTPESKCPHCGGEMVSEELMNEKKDACYYKVKSRYKVWPSAYASGALVKCRKKGASNWGTKSKK